MGALIRRGTAGDAAQWVNLLKDVLGEDCPCKQAYDPAWIAGQLDPGFGHETWVAAEGDRLLASVSLLTPAPSNGNPIVNLGRNLNRPESYADGSAKALLSVVNELAEQRACSVVGRVLASDNAQQVLFENLGYVCAGFQPYKHLLRKWEGVLFYVRLGKSESEARYPLTTVPSQLRELGMVVLNQLDLAPPQAVNDGIVGYPLQTDLRIREADYRELLACRQQAQASNPSVEISTGYNPGCGLLRIASEKPPRAVLGMRAGRVAGGMAYLFDDQDRCVRILDSFSTSDLAAGALCRHVLEVAQTELNAVYLEVDVLLTASRLLKSAEQLGFVPAAYLPAFCLRNEQCVDVAKMVKLNLVYSLENVTLTARARQLVEVVDHNFQDQKVGVAIINLLRGLQIFAGLGDGELRKIARLFTQRLFRPGEVVFERGDAGNEAFVVMRGKVGIFLDDQSDPVGTVTNGQVFGEQAFLDGAARVARAVASEASILLIVQRAAYNELVQREPHLGMTVMRNTAIDLSNKLRRSNALLTAAKR
ncbi:MAG: cyclic nucleotide-binding domain-containing protein [Candidatus Omnitrophica bacterium]|nr:cyclic nucleotide-binding domain-containing protein [Candidatus Omnitrophota bacterium]